VFDIDLTTAPAPRYPTAEEIAEAQSRYVAGLLESLANFKAEATLRAY